MIECKICRKEFNSTKGLGQHLGKSHNINATSYTIKFILEKNIPLCKCGCGE